MWPPSRTGIGSRLSRPRFRLIDRHQAEERDPAELRRLAGQLRDRHRPHQLLGRRLAREQPPDRLEDQAGATRRSARTLSPTASSGPGLMTLASRRPMPTPSSPMSPRLRGRHGDGLPARRRAESTIVIGCSGCFAMASLQLRRRTSSARRRPPGRRRLAFRPARSRRLAGRHRLHVRVHVRQHADVADLEPALARRHDRRDRRVRISRPFAQKRQRRFAIRPRADRDEELLPGVDVAARHRDDAIAGLKIAASRPASPA